MVNFNKKIIGLVMLLFMFNSVSAIGYMTSVDFSVIPPTTYTESYDELLYITMPCLTEFMGDYGITSNGKNRYIKILEETQGNSGVYENTMNNLWTNESYETCLVRGRIEGISNDTFSTNYNIVDVQNQLQLGTLTDLDSSPMMNNYIITLENEDIYSANEPEFWGKTWADLFVLLISVIIGAGTIVGGVLTRSGKIVLIGILIIAGGLGITMNLSLFGVGL